MYNVQALNFSVWGEMFNYLPGLLTLCLERVDLEPFWGKITCQVPKLRSVVVGQCPLLAIESIAQVIRSSTCLKRLSIFGCSFLEQVSLFNIGYVRDGKVHPHAN